jgi:hypothetical protein
VRLRVEGGQVRGKQNFGGYGKVFVFCFPWI